MDPVVLAVIEDVDAPAHGVYRRLDQTLKDAGLTSADVSVVITSRAWTKGQTCLQWAAIHEILFDPLPYTGRDVPPEQLDTDEIYAINLSILKRATHVTVIGDLTTPILKDALDTAHGQREKGKSLWIGQYMV